MSSEKKLNNNRILTKILIGLAVIMIIAMVVLVIVVVGSKKDSPSVNIINNPGIDQQKSDAKKEGDLEQKEEVKEEVFVPISPDELKYSGSGLTSAEFCKLTLTKFNKDAYIDFGGKSTCSDKNKHVTSIDAWKGNRVVNVIVE